MSSPYETCRDAFNLRYPTHSFANQVAYYAATGGVVHCTPDYFVMGRKVHHTATASQMRSLLFPGAQRDCWFFAWFAGDMEKVWAAETPLEYVAFEREREGEMHLQIVKTSIMRRLTCSNG